ncbi:glycosyltransferase family 2 protein [Brevibacterium marinum]|uniref:Glycosyltransferase involved in cell wall biosynthesis n=1 Tax=Brevibacterium marinum TaxID=418643 RepID=A0A846S196_9MICO|nr:glycosyltransferase family A protein [Brevibacterium marinum]NJC55941.1 glycosyltransferase involved in cell wall biosynthesis [Brevibacterium marinum]
MSPVLVSVIIPVFDGEDTISDCLRSVTSQTHLPLEIIVVDDGSHDATADIVRRLAAEDGRIDLIVQDNQGVSAARNRGLAAASGEWVMFVDADDAFADPVLVEAVVRAGDGTDLDGGGTGLGGDGAGLDWEGTDLDGEGAGPTGEGADLVGKRVDLVGYGVRRRAGAGAAGLRTSEEPRSVEAMIREAQDTVLDTESIAGMVLDESANAVWDKAYRRSLITNEGCSFPEGIRMGEDLLFNVACLSGADRVRILPIDGYLYRCDNADSATRRYLPDKFADLMYVNDELRKWAATSGAPELVAAAEYIRAKNVLSCMQDLHHHDCDLPRRDRLRTARRYRTRVPAVDASGLGGRRRMLCLAYNAIGVLPMFHLARLTGALR